MEDQHRPLVLRAKILRYCNYDNHSNPYRCRYLASTQIHQVVWYTHNMPRNRAVAVVIHENKLLVMYRKNNKDGEFYVFPGGGVEQGETNEQATIREIDEEASIEIKIDRLLYELHHGNGDIHYFFLCTYVGGTPAIRIGTNEHAENIAGEEFHKPEWVDLDTIENLVLYPKEATDQLVIDLREGFSDETIIMERSLTTAQIQRVKI